MAPQENHSKENPRSKGHQTKKQNKPKKRTKKAKVMGMYLRIKCPICFDNINKESASSTKCGHVFCTSCLKKALRRTPMCPTCRTRLKGSTGHHPLYLDTICEDVNDYKMDADVGAGIA